MIFMGHVEDYWYPCCCPEDFGMGQSEQATSAPDAALEVRVATAMPAPLPVTRAPAPKREYVWNPIAETLFIGAVLGSMWLGIGYMLVKDHKRETAAMSQSQRAEYDRKEKRGPLVFYDIFKSWEK
jgi:hypothetical protein